MVPRIRLQLALICADTCPGNSLIDHGLGVGLVSSCGQKCHGEAAETVHDSKMGHYSKAVILRPVGSSLCAELPASGLPSTCMVLVFPA